MEAITILERVDAYIAHAEAEGGSNNDEMTITTDMGPVMRMTFGEFKDLRKKMELS